MEKRNCLLGLIDILGFTQMIEKDDATAINDIIETVKENIHYKRGAERYGSSPELDVIGFSDTILFSTEWEIVDNSHKISHLMEVCAGIQRSLINKGILCRGSITYGDHSIHKSEEMTYFPSKAYIRAFKLEKDVAIYPRIILDENLLVAIDDCLKKKYLIRDIHGTYFLDYLTRLDNEQRVEIEKVIMKGRLDNLNSKDRGVYEKFSWLDSYYRWTYSESINYFVRE